MAFKKGIAANPTGRKPGTQNKKTVEHINRAKALIEKIEGHPKFVNMLDSLSEKEMAALYTQLLEYTQPRLARQEVTDSEGGPLVINVLHSAAPVRQIQETREADFIEINSNIKPF